MINHLGECIEALRPSFKQLSDQAHQIGEVEGISRDDQIYRRMFDLGRMVDAANSLCGHRPYDPRRHRRGVRDARRR
jgi:hypothetical protein